MPRINRRVRTFTQPRRSRAQVLELLLGPNGEGTSAFKSEKQRLETWTLLARELSEEFAEQWYVAQREHKDYAAIAEQYAEDVVARRIPAGKKVVLACRRHLNDLARAREGNWAYRFDAVLGSRVCRFAELLPHVKGEWAARAELVHLEAWQIFILVSLFGWVRVSDGSRRFNLAYIEVARKNAKSTLAAIIGIYMFACDGEFGAEVYSGATKEDQALEVFRPALQMLDRSPELRMVLGVDIPSSTSKKMRIGEDGSRFEVVVRDPGDGSSPHCGIVDEYHEHDADTLLDTFRTGMGARRQPLLLVITTAGFNTGGPCMALQQDISEMLEGLSAREERFGIIYSIDPEDDWTTEEALRKSNPNYGVSVRREFLLTEQSAAIVTARKQNVFLTKHMCVWCGANASYFNLQRWRELGDASLKEEQFVGMPCAISVDLSTKRDFTARAKVFRRTEKGRVHYYIFVTLYLPKEQIERPDKQNYQAWHKSGAILACGESTIDFEQVEADTVADVRRFKPKEFAFDPWNAAQFGQAVATKTRATPVEIPQTVRYLSAPTKELDAAMADGRVHHDGNPALAWMIGNVVAHEDVNENVLPQKAADENKIDGAAAAILALSRMIVAEPRRSVYATRGVLVA